MNYQPTSTVRWVWIRILRFLAVDVWKAVVIVGHSRHVYCGKYPCYPDRREPTQDNSVFGQQLISLNGMAWCETRTLANAQAPGQSLDYIDLCINRGWLKFDNMFPKKEWVLLHHDYCSPHLRTLAHSSPYSFVYSTGLWVSFGTRVRWRVTSKPRKRFEHRRVQVQQMEYEKCETLGRAGCWTSQNSLPHSISLKDIYRTPLSRWEYLWHVDVPFVFGRHSANASEREREGFSADAVRKSVGTWATLWWALDCKKPLVDCLLRLLLAGVGIECQGRRHVFSVFQNSRIFFNDIRHMTYDVSMILYMIYDMLGWFCFSVSSLSEMPKGPSPLAPTYFR